MPKQRGGWKGKPKHTPVAVEEESDAVSVDEIEQHHRASVTGGTAQFGGKQRRAAESANDLTEDDPVLGLATDDLSEEEEEEDDDADGGGSGDDSSSEGSDSDAEATAKQAVDREDALLTAWGRKKAAFYSADQEVEIDDDAAAAEEVEARRLQQQRAQELDEDDASMGLLLRGGAAAAGAAAASRAEAGAGAARGGVEVVGKRLEGLTRDERLAIVEADTPELLGLLAELSARTQELRGTLQPALRAATAAAGAAALGPGGLSYLQVRHGLLLGYLTHITFYLLLRAEGRPVAAHPVIAELVRTRALLNKMRPLDAKMAPTVARLLKAAAAAGPANTGDAAEGHGRADGAAASSAAASRPRPLALLAHGASALGASKAAGKGRVHHRAADTDDDDGLDVDGVAAEEEEEEAGAEPAAYVPLRRAAVPYDADPAAAKAARALARESARLSRSGLLADLRAAYTDAPEEEDDGGGGAGGGGGMAGRTARDDALARLAADRTAHEEETMTRVQVDKAERRARKAQSRERGRWDALAELEHYGDLAAAGLGGDGDDGNEPAAAAAGGKKAAGAWRGSGAAADTAVSLARLQKAVPPPAVANEDGGAVGSKRGRPASAAARGRGDDGDDDDAGSGGGGGAGEDPFYAAVAAAAAHKKARRADRTEEHAAASRSFLQARTDEDQLLGDGEEEDGGAVQHRKASRTILANRGLVKYRKRDDKNPRVHYRHKAEAAVKRRKGQVVPMRDAGREAGQYAGEATGIRTGVTHSRKIRG